MNSSITDLMQQVHNHFLSLYQKNNNVITQETFLTFDSGASPPISIESFRQPGQADFSEVLATEEFSTLVNQVTQINANRFTPNGNQVEEQYEMLVLGGMSRSETENDQVFFGRMRDQAEERLKNSKMGRARIGAPPIPYCQSFASPSNWYRPDAVNNWTSYTLKIAEKSQTSTETKPIVKAAVRSAIALDLNQPWTLQVLPDSLTPVLKQPEMLDRIAVQEVAPQLDRSLHQTAPIQFKRDDLLRSVAAGNLESTRAEVIQQPKAIQFERLGQKISAFFPKSSLSKVESRVNPNIISIAEPIADRQMIPGKAMNIGRFDRSLLVGRNYYLQHIVNKKILEQSRTESIRSSELSVSFDYCWVNIDRRWFYNPYLQTRNWYIPGFQVGELSQPPIPNSPTSDSSNPNPNPKAFPAIPIAVLLVKNLRIQANWQAQEFQSVQNSMALGPFSLVGRSIEQGTGAIVQPGMQVMGWVCQVMPALPPSPAPL